MTADEARAARDQALEQVEQNAHEHWRDVAERALDVLIGRGVQFDADDVWVEIARIDQEAATHEPRALGPVVMRAIREGRIVNAGWRNSTRASRHGAPIATYTVVHR